MQQIKVNMVSESEFTVQGHGVHTAYVELTRALRRSDSLEVVVNDSAPDADITHIQTVGLYALLRLLARGGKKVVSVHVVPDSLVGSLILAKYWRGLARVYLKWFYGRADMLFAVSKMVATELIDDMKIDPAKVKLMYNTVDMSQYACAPEDRASARKTLGIKDSEFVVLGNGQIQPRKRFDTFVQVARQLPNVRFIWVGGIPFKHLGAEYGHMQDLIATAPRNLKTTGVIPLEQVRAYVHAADVFFLPAEQENHPMCVLEAAGAGLPIILRDIPQYTDTFASDSTLIHDADEATLAIQKLRDDPAAYAAAQRGAEAIARRFDSTAGAKRAEELYRELLGR